MPRDWSFNILKNAENRVAVPWSFNIWENRIAVPFTSRGLTFFVNPREKRAKTNCATLKGLNP